MQRSLIDHIVVTSPTLDAGAKFVKKKLGVEPQTGGEHPAMGTHNKLLRLGDDSYLEVIAANPAMPSPGRPRWFALDRLSAAAAPSLAAWVVRVGDIHAVQAVVEESLGVVEPMSRGDLNWLITIPAEGLVPLDGVAPALIEWRTPQLPARGLPDAGLRLLGLNLYHPDPQRVGRMLAELGLDGPVSFFSLPEGQPPYLRARISTPHGIRDL